MNLREAASLVAAAVFAGGTSTWAIASAAPAVDLPPAPTLSTSTSSSASHTRSRASLCGVPGSAAANAANRSPAFSAARGSGP